MSFDVELKNIAKSFDDVRANEAVNLKIRQGTIHALVGENGAGKSTTMKILFGLHAPDSGQILIDGKPTPENWNPHDAFEMGIGMVHQHFMLALPETVHDNLVLGVETVNFLGMRDRQKERARIEKLMRDTNLSVPLDKPVRDLPISQQSRVEILKVLYRDAKLLILDEPTAVLTPSEVEEFLRTLKKLREHGCTILIVTHKLKEVINVADEVTVLRAGKTVATRKVVETSVEELAELMVGRKLFLPKADIKNSESSHVMLTLNVATEELQLRSGIITGIAGVEGNGQEELIENLIQSAHSEKIPLALIPADRHHEGSILPFSLTENLRLTRRYHDNAIESYNRTYKKPISKFSKTRNEELAILKEYDVRPQIPTAAIGSLSGGNQQKLIVGRELTGVTQKHIVLAVHPTRGVDLGAIEFIHRKLLETATTGATILLISSELEELMALSHRISTLYHGRLSGSFEGPDYDEKKIGFAMLGGSETT